MVLDSTLETYASVHFVTCGKTIALSRSVEGWYWERMNSVGETIDNLFTVAAARVEVTIDASDYAFNSTRCVQWSKTGYR